MTDLHPLVLILAFVISSAFQTMADETIQFEDAPAAAAPAGWTVAVTGKGTPSWQVVADPTAPSAAQVLQQSGRADFPLCTRNASSLKNGFVEVTFKPISGRIDQAAGLVWRFRDADNYYVVRANALEDNVVLYKVEDGRRSALDIVGRKGGYGLDAKVANKQWQVLRVEFNEDLFTVFLDTKQLFQVKDATFQAAGRVGLWTKADSNTHFDDFSYGEVANKTGAQKTGL
ncbi:MAG: hypothetical protein ACI9TH_003186 [Kiritimatiellia bacterium]|jgi:hypothetical protein